MHSNEWRFALSSTRSYNSPTRAADAAETRARIVASAGRLFVRDGYVATSMRAIADEASVSVQSVHLAGPKASLLLAAYEVALVGDEGRHSWLERPAMVEILAMPDSMAAVAAFVDFVAASYVRAADIWGALRSAADADPRVRAEVAAQDRRRHADLERGADWFISRGLVAPEDRQTAADVLGFLTWEQSYLYFVETCGWSIERYAAWMLDGIKRMLIGATSEHAQEERESPG